MTIVGIGHKLRRGKDTAADALVRELGYTRFSFADKLKELALGANPLILTEPGFQNVQVGHNSLKGVVERYGWDHAKSHYPLIRTFLQNLGNGARDVFGENFWFDAWRHAADVWIDNTPGAPPSFQLDGKNIVVPDLRFVNEANGLKNLGAVLIRIDRVVYDGTDNDISENDLNEFTDWDAIIVNDGSITDLQRKIVETVQELTA